MSLNQMGPPPVEAKIKVWFMVLQQVHDNLYFLPSVSNSEVTFVWSSEKSGYRHLYKVTSKLKNCDTYKSAVTPLYLELNTSEI
jgi:hypothetical protein